MKSNFPANFVQKDIFFYTTFLGGLYLNLVAGSSLSAVCIILHIHYTCKYYMKLIRQKEMEMIINLYSSCSPKRNKERPI